MAKSPTRQSRYGDGARPVDIRRLRPTQLLRLLNSTALGPVMTRSQLRRQMDTAALRVGDGETVHLVRYTRWLVREYLRPPEVREVGGYAAALERARARGSTELAEVRRADTRAAQDIAPVPDVADWQRRAAGTASLRTFCETYFADAFYRPWSPDHLRAIEKIERVVESGGLFAFAMPRGSGKTTLCRVAALWAVLAGYRLFVCLIGGSEPRALDLLRPTRLAMLENALLLVDWPEAVYPLRCLENSSKRQLSQHVGGRLTHVHWGDDKLVFPTLAAEALPPKLRAEGYERSPSEGAIISVTSLDANIRGQQHTTPAGRVLRPSLVLLDDPQTRQSARSVVQTKYRLQLLYGDPASPLATPGQACSAWPGRASGSRP